MRWYYTLPLRLRSLFRKQQAERELNDEMQFHLQNQIDEYVASGLWEGKAGGFGYQDRLGWLHVLSGSESNVVGLPDRRANSGSQWTRCITS